MSSPRNLYNDLVVSAIAPVATSTATSVAVTSFDRLNTDNAVHELVALVDIGTVINTVTMTMVESDSTDVPADMTTVSTGEYQGTNPLVIGTGNDNAAFLTGYLGSKRYVGYSMVGSTGIVGDLVVSWLAADPRHNVR